MRRGALLVLGAVAVLVAPETLLRLTHAGPDLTDVVRQPSLAGVLTVFLVLFRIVDLGLGLATLAGRNWARLSLMVSRS